MKNKNMLTVYFDSSLDHLEKDKAKRYYACINAVVFVIDQLNSRFARLENEFICYKNWMESSGKGIEKGKINVNWGYSEGDRMVCDAWDIIDWTERLRKILNSASGIRKKDSWFKDITQAISIAKPVRNFNQHFDREISKFVSGQYPLMGTVYAYLRTGSGYSCYILPSSPVKSPYDNMVNIGRIVRPVSPNKEVENVCFAIENHVLNISQVILKINSGASKLEEYLKEEYNFRWINRNLK